MQYTTEFHRKHHSGMYVTAPPFKFQCISNTCTGNVKLTNHFDNDEKLLTTKLACSQFVDSQFINSQLVNYQLCFN